MYLCTNLSSFINIINSASIMSTLKFPNTKSALQIPGRCTYLTETIKCGMLDTMPGGGLSDSDVG